MPQSIDWTISDVPDPDEPAPAPPAVPPKPRPVRRIAWVISIVILSALLLLVGYNFWNADQVRRSVYQTIAREEAAGSSGDVATLWDIGDPNDWTWREALIGLAVSRQAAPLPALVLRLMPNQADRITVTQLAQNEVRADVTRSYRAPDGALLAFTLPQKPDVVAAIRSPEDLAAVLTLKAVFGDEFRLATAEEITKSGTGAARAPVPPETPPT
jgi:hypothetical protein